MGQPKHFPPSTITTTFWEVIVIMLQERCYRVSSVSGGVACEIFFEAGDKVDCVILDALMPGEASASLALHLKQKGISVVIVSRNRKAMKCAEDNGLQLLQPFRAQEL
jgi:CheY-like chemotaxis protein